MVNRRAKVSEQELWNATFLPAMSEFQRTSTIALLSQVGGILLLHSYSDYTKVLEFNIALSQRE